MWMVDISSLSVRPNDVGDFLFLFSNLNNSINMLLGRVILLLSGANET